MTISEILEHFPSYRRLNIFSLAVTLLVLWAFSYVVRPLSAWLVREFQLRTNGIPKGPTFLEAASLAATLQPQNLYAKWVKQFGSIFWYNMGPYHVCCPNFFSQAASRSMHHLSLCLTFAVE
jgi:hypothetical protein